MCHESATESELQEILGYGLEPEPMAIFKPITPRINLNDGESLSVQASSVHYSSPRDDAGPWSAVEVGYPSSPPDDDWREYFDGDWDSGDRTGSVYGYVPIELVLDFINFHGGIKEGDDDEQ
jgi:hypothetical protein